MAISSENFETHGFSSKMGPLLRHAVEQQLREDLVHYEVQHADLHFDWSASCLEGSDAAWLDGHIENFSGITLLNQQGQTVVEGWMEFILADGRLLVHWDDLASWNAFEKHVHKSHFGIPPHIWNNLPEHIQHLYRQERMQAAPKLP